GDETTFMGTKPFESGGSGGGVADAHADPAHYSETNDQSGVALHQTGNNTSGGQEQPTDGSSDFGAVLVLDPPARNHQKSEHDDAQREGGRNLSVAQVRPGRIDPGQGRSEQSFVNFAAYRGHGQLPAPYAPCIQNSQAQIDSSTCESDNPRFSGHFFQWSSHSISPFTQKTALIGNMG